MHDYLIVHVDVWDERTQSMRFKVLGSEFCIMVSQYVSVPTIPKRVFFDDEE